MTYVLNYNLDDVHNRENYMADSKDEARKVGVTLGLFKTTSSSVSTKHNFCSGPAFKDFGTKSACAVPAFQDGEIKSANKSIKKKAVPPKDETGV